jgi:sec-independent protein translocase protein TatC
VPLFSFNTANIRGASFFDHLEVLRHAIIRIALALVVVAVVIFLNGGWVYENIILGPRNPGFLTNRLFCELGSRLEIPVLCINSVEWSDVNLDLAGQFTFHLALSINGAFIVIVPYVLLELWWFVKPGLYARERRNSRGFVLVTSLLFYFGALFGYYIIMPLSVNFLANYTVHKSIINQFQLLSYIRILITTVLSTGLVFEMPLLIWFLSRMGIITTSFLRKFRKHVVVIISIVAAIITPPDVLSQLIVAIPLYLLFELGVRVAYRNEKRADAERVN